MKALYPGGTIPFTHDYQSELYNSGKPSYEFTGSFNGGSAATQYFVNLTGKNEEGTALNTGARLYALRTNIDQSLVDGKVKVNVGLNVTRNSNNRGLSNNDNTCTSPIYCFAYTPGDRKSTRLNSSHSQISYAVFCLKKKKEKHQ